MIFSTVFIYAGGSLWDIKYDTATVGAGRVRGLLSKCHGRGRLDC